MTRTIAILFLMTAADGFAQASLSFVAASVKPNVKHEVNREGRPKGFINATPGYFVAENSTLGDCLEWAYHVQGYQVSGPSWMETERYDISAKAEGPAATEQLRLMLQTLLKQRFKLSFHREMKELPGYALLVAKDGPKLHESTTDGEPAMTPNRAVMTAERMTMARFTEILMQPLHSPVADLTGLTGRYDFSLDISKYVKPDSPQDDMIPALADCLNQELGLRIEPRKMRFESIVVDHAEKTPVEN